MVVMKSSVFPAARETVFEKLQKLETLQYIARPYATFEPVGAAKLVWEVGSTSAYRFRLFGVVPFGTHKIYIVRFDPEGVSSREGNEHVPVWNHDITMVSLDGSHTKYTDRVEIRAGWKTPHLFMGPFTKLGKIFDLNRPSHMWLIDKVFRKSGNRDRKDILRYPEGFVNVDAPYDKEHHAASYSFTQCPNAEFAKKHGLLHILPLLCNSDFFGISEIHGTLIRCGTCGNSDVCDYLVVGSDNPIAKEYETSEDRQGFLVSRKRLSENVGESS